MSPVPKRWSACDGGGAYLLVAAACLGCVTLVLGGAVASASTNASPPAATLRDPANDVRAGDVDLTSISVGKRGEALVVRFTVRKPITDDVSYTASVGAGLGSWALVARRGGGADSFLLYDLSTGSTTPVTGAIRGRTASVAAPIAQLGGQTAATLGRVRAYFRAEPIGSRSGSADRAATTGPTVYFCLADRKPRPKWGRCIWPGQVR
jgi:hypothetical protein